LPYRSPVEVGKRKDEILNVWGKEDDTPKTFTQICILLPKADRFWKGQSGERNLSKYLEELVKKDKRLILIGERGKGKKGATYRPNRAGITKENYIRDLEKLYDDCLSDDLYNSGDLAWVDCRLLGVPPDKKLTAYEHEIVRVIREKLADAWQLTYFLKYVLAARILSGQERRDVSTLRTLYEHEFFHGVRNIFFFKEPDIREWKDLLEDLVHQLTYLSKKHGVVQEVNGYFASFKRIAESFPPEVGREVPLSELLIDEASPLPKGFSEKLALLVTQSATQSEEFRGRIENYISRTVKFSIEVNRDGCIACATCYTLDPAHYESDSEGKSKVVGGISNGKSAGTFDDDKIEDARTAEGSCPVSVIVVNKI
jgi:ferredoxin